MDWTLIGGFVALAALIVGLLRDVKGDVRDIRRDVGDLRTDARQWVDDLRTETRAAHAQTGKRIDDMHATLLAIVPRAAAEPADRA